ncbi:glycosyl transferase family 2 [Winogradskyella sp. PC-19]|uniref:glycosyltransferase n=1 Tax=unclassified Winogradskyella TaxID=2615021 RepID=UPI000B3C400A|nr:MULTISPECIES: glycosyltransferase [unclassified Winogradskyella]ARV10287.1 glycosyl transferase family 2 [Winogradskyella sp. PC-19]RZN75445.1 MAG: glycosyltransferase [Winogradskyella sp.]
MTTLQILFYSFIAVASIQIIYYFFFLSFFSSKKSKKYKSKNIALSVIICAKNEAGNLKKNLTKIINQDYKNFEIVLINDSSWDDTLEIMETFEAKHDNISIVDVKSIEQFWGNKKYALTLGIKASKNEFLVFTDADCIPTSDKWLKEISQGFSNTKSIVLGFGGYKKVKYSFLNALIRFETLMTAIQYFSYAKAGIPYMGVGRNLAYRKELFFNNGGFMNHMSIKSGDDDLFISESANSKNTAICFSKDSFTLSEPKTTFKDWIIQKRRHVSTSKYYKPIHKSLLGLFYLSQIAFWILAITLLCFLYQWSIVVAIIIFRVLLQWLTTGKAANKLDSKDLTIFSPFLEVFLIIFQLAIFSANLISKPKHWK